MVSQSDDADLIERVDTLLGQGYIGTAQAQLVAQRFPQAPGEILAWLNQMSIVDDWRRFNRFVLLAAEWETPGLASVLVPLLDAPRPGVNTEDLVDVAGQLEMAEAAPAITRLLRERQADDGPYYGFCRKCIEALGGIGTKDARQALDDLARHADPRPLRWYAAVELDIEDELGYDEEDMLSDA